MAGFSIDAIRNANRISILFSDTDASDAVKASDDTNVSKTFKDSSKRFTAYLKDGFGFTLKPKYSRFGGQQIAFGGDSITNKVIGQLIQQVAGIETLIDFASNIRFTGSDPLNFNVNCFLYAENSWDDVEKEFEKLCSQVLPVKSKNTEVKVEGNASDINSISFQVGDGEKKTIGQFCTDHGIPQPDKDSTIWGLAAKGILALSKMLTPAYLLEVPEAYKENHHVDVVIGNFLIRDVVIDSVGVTVPKFYMEGGMPNYLDLQIAFQTKRSTYAGVDGGSSNIPLFGYNKVKFHNTEA